MELPDEITELIIDFGGPEVAALLSTTSRYMRATHRTFIRTKATNHNGTVILWRGPRWSTYWDLADWTIYFMNTDNMLQTHITVISKRTGRTLKALLTHDLGIHGNESKTVFYYVRNSGLMEDSTTYYHFDFVLDGINYQLGITHTRPDNHIIFIQLKGNYLSV